VRKTPWKKPGLFLQFIREKKTGDKTTEKKTGEKTYNYNSELVHSN